MPAALDRAGQHLAQLKQQLAQLRGVLPHHSLDVTVELLLVLGGQLLRRQDQHRDVPPLGMLTDREQELEPVHLRHHQVEQDHVGRRFGELLEREAAVARPDDLPLLPLENPPHALAHDLVVVHQQHLARDRAADLPQQRDQPRAVDRLGQVFGGAEGVAAAAVVLDGHEHHRYVGEQRIALDRRQDRPAVEVGHVDVQRDRRRMQRPRQLEPLAAPGRGANRETLALEIAAHHVADGLIVVDDDQAVCDVMGRYLEREGFAVRTATGGREGLKLARELHPAAITLDINMSDLDGWTVLAAIKGDPLLANIPVVLVTIEDNRSRGYSLGATEYLTKPIDRERLIALLREISSPVARKVLLVDDDEIMRESVRRVLEQEQWEVIGASNGRFALEQLAESAPDVILLDLMMPEMDGFEFLLAIRLHPEWRDIPVLVLTAKDLTAEDQKQLNGYVERVMRKNASELGQLLFELSQMLPRSIERGRHARSKEILA